MKIKMIGASFVAATAFFQEMGGQQALAQSSESLRAPQHDAEEIIILAPGNDLEKDEALNLDSADISRDGRPDLLGALTRNAAGVTLQDAQSNPWQPNLVYRGFTASPLQGLSQGLAVYLDGARFNQPFGDSVRFDLIPQSAIQSLSLYDANPIYGLNALGGALALSTKTGVSSPGGTVSISGGAYESHREAASFGFSDKAWSGFFSVEHEEDGGWRRHSPSSLINAYADIGYRGENAGAHIKFFGADTDLTGNGVVPVQLFAVDRRAVFTYPDNTRSLYNRISFHPWVNISDETQLTAATYIQHLRLRTLNGDAADIEDCDDIPNFLCLGVGEDPATGQENQELLIDANGAPIPENPQDPTYAVLNRSQSSIASQGILLQIQDDRPLENGRNRFVAGLSYDRSRTQFHSWTRLGSLDATRGVQDIGYEIRQPSGAIAPTNVIAKSYAWGIFLTDQFPITDRLTAEAGVRWNHIRIILDDQIGTALNGRHAFSRINPNAELSYRVLDDLGLRIGYNETSRAPTPAELSCADPDAPCSLSDFFIADPPLEQVVARTVEMGLLWEKDLLGWTTIWDIAAYRTDTDNDIQRIASNVRGRGYFQNVGQNRRQGIEASLHATTSNLTSRLSYAFTDAISRAALTLPSPENPAADDEGRIFVAPGDRLPGIPRHSVTLAMDYEGQGWTLGGDAIGRSSQYLIGDESNQNAPLAGYVTFNLRGTVTLAKRLVIFGSIRNLLDRDYATFGTFGEVDEVPVPQVPGGLTNPRTYGPAAPRRWTIGLRANF